MRLHPSPEENYSGIRAPCQRAKWKSNDEQTEAFRPLRDGASRYQKLAPGNSKPRTKPNQAFYIPRAHCQNSAERRREVKFNYNRREVQSRKPNSSGNKEGRDPRKGRIDPSNMPAEDEKEEGVSSGQTCTSEDTAPLIPLVSGEVAFTEEGEKCSASNLEPEGDAQKDTPSEDSAVDQILDESPAEPKEKQGPSSKEEMRCLSHEGRAENDGPGLYTASTLVEDVEPSLELARDVDREPPILTLTSETAQATVTSPGGQCSLQGEDDGALNHERPPTCSAVDLAGRLTQSVENVLGDQEEEEEEEESSNSDNVRNPGDSAAPLQGGVGAKTEEPGTKGPDPQNSGVDSADLIKELSAFLGDTSISIEQPQSDYSTYLLGEVRMGELEFGHVIEIYDFLPQLKTEDIQEAFGSFRDKGFRIKWVDSTHALGLFSSPDSASEALSISHSQLKTRPLAQATKQSKLKVARCSEFLQPVKERAQTNTVIAKRLVIRALGLQTSDRKWQRDPKPKYQGETKGQPHKKTEDGIDDTLDCAGDPGAE